MASSSSSTKKAARLAQKGKGQKVRFQGGTLFPMIVAIVIVLGLALVFYARESRPAADASAPQLEDHWHHAYGFYLCDTWFQLQGNAEERDSSGFTNKEFERTGVHSHEDGLIHWHAYSTAAVGRRAILGVFLDVYGVDLTNNKLVFPSEQRAFLPYENETGVFEGGETTCVIDGKEEKGEIKVVVWENYTDTDSGTTYIADYNNIRLDSDAKVVAIAFVPDDTDVSMPPWAPDLPELGQIDSNQLTPADLPGATTVPDDDSHGG
ncbi:MAG: hypothetical protein KUG57_04200 [Ilumatobacteraceae bacterium]|nr:hypothetical protein [Ilumatobacteraceae bacterium]